MLYLLDSSAILNRFDFVFAEGNEYLMPPRAIGECRDFRSRNLVESVLQSGLLAVHDPRPASLQQAQAKAQALRLPLSPADLEVAAAALDLQSAKVGFKVLTDDFALQALLKAFNLPFEGVFRGTIGQKPRKPGK